MSGDNRPLLELKDLKMILGELRFPFEKRDPIPYTNFDEQQGAYIIAISKSVPHSVFDFYFEKIVAYVDVVAKYSHTQHEDIEFVQTRSRELAEDLASTNNLLGEMTGIRSDEQGVVAQSVLEYLTSLANSTRGNS